MAYAEDTLYVDGMIIQRTFMRIDEIPSRFVWSNTLTDLVLRTIILGRGFL